MSYFREGSLPLLLPGGLGNIFVEIDSRRDGYYKENWFLSNYFQEKIL